MKNELKVLLILGYIIFLIFGYTVYCFWDIVIFQTSNESTKTPVRIESQAEKYQKWIDKQFSEWDGSCSQLKEITKKSLNDEDSFKHISTKYWEFKDMKSIKIIMEFSCKNSFGGVVKNYSTCVIMRNGDIQNFEIIGGQ